MEAYELELPLGSTSGDAMSMQTERRPRRSDAVMHGSQANGSTTAAQRSRGGGVPSPFTPGFNSMERTKRPTRPPRGIEQDEAYKREQRETRFGPSPADKFYSNLKPKPARADVSTSRAALRPRPAMLAPGVETEEIDWRRPGTSNQRTRADSSPLSPAPASDAGPSKPRRSTARPEPQYIDVAGSDDDDDDGVNSPHVPEPSSLRGRSAASSSTRSVSPQKRASHSPTKVSRGGRPARASERFQNRRSEDLDALNDPIQDPDEDEGEIQYTGTSGPGPSGGKGKGKAAPPPRREGQRATTSRSRSPAKAPSGPTREAESLYKGVRSSALGPKLKDAVTAGVHTATLGGHPLHIHTLGFEGDQLSITGQDMSPFPIPLHAMKCLEICQNAAHPLVFGKLSLNDGLNFTRLRRLLDTGDLRKTAGFCDFIVLLTTGTESADFIKNFRNVFQKKKWALGTLTDPACDAIRQSVPVWHDSHQAAFAPSSDAQQEALFAAEQRRAVELSKKPVSRPRRSDGNSEPSKDAAMSRKGKGKNKEDPTQAKLLFPTLEPQYRQDSTFPMPPPSGPAAGNPVRRSTRHSGGASLNYAEPDENADPEVVVSAPPSRNLPPPPVDRNALLFPWPLQGRADLHITAGDLYRVTSGDFLNDTLLEFGLRHVLSELESQRKVGPDEVHMFNSFFYNKLSKKTKSRKIGDPDWPAYDSVKKWTKNEDIFAKKFIVVPINENMHWYLAVIFNPAGVLRQAATPPPAPAAHRRVTRAQGTDGEESEAVEEIEDRPAAGKRVDVADSDLDELEDTVGDAAPQRSEADEDGDISMSEPNRVADESVDELALNDDSNDHAFVIGRGIKEGSVESAGMVAVGNKIRQLSIDPSPEKPRPIESSTLSFFQSQFQQPETASAEVVESPPQPTKKGKPLLPDVEILGSEGCWIMTFDSLGGSHKAVHTCLNEWLKFEAKHKRDVQYEMTDATYWEARVPSQPNFSDCGLFLIHYARQLLERPNEMLAFIQRRPPPTSTPENKYWSEDRDRLWHLEETSDLRQFWALIIESLQLQSDLIRQGRNASEAEAEAAKAMESRHAALSAAHVSEQADQLDTSQNSVVELSQPPKRADQRPFEGASREASKFPVDAEDAEEAIEAVEQGEAVNQSSFDFARGLVGHGATSTPNGTKSYDEDHIDPSLYGPALPVFTPSKIDPRLSSPGVIGHMRPRRHMETRGFSSSEEEEPIEEGGLATLYSQVRAGAGLPADGRSHHGEREMLHQQDPRQGPSDNVPRWKVLSAADNAAGGPIDQPGDAQPDPFAGGDEDVFMGSGTVLAGPSHQFEATHEMIVAVRNADMDRDILDDNSEQVAESQHASDSGDTRGEAAGSRTQQGDLESDEDQKGGKQPNYDSDKARRPRSPIPGPYLSDRPEQDDQLVSVSSTRDTSRSTSPNTTTTSDSKLSFKPAGFRSPRHGHPLPHEHPPRPQPPVPTVSPFEGFGNALNSRRGRGLGPAAASQSMEVSEAGMENLIMATPRTRGGLAVVPTTWAAGADDAGLNGVGVVSSEDKSALGANGSDVWHEQELAPDHVEPRPLRPSFDEFGPEDDTLSGTTTPARSEEGDVPLHPMGTPRGPHQTTLDHGALGRHPSASSPPISSSSRRGKVVQCSGKSKGEKPSYARKTTGNAPPSAKGAKRSGEEQDSPVIKAKRLRSGKSGAEESKGPAKDRPRKGKGRGGGGAGEQSLNIRTRGGGGEGDTMELPIEIASTDDEAEKQGGDASGDEDEDVEK